MNAAAVALAASAAKHSCRYTRGREVAVLSTGDELVDVETTPGPTSDPLTPTVILWLRNSFGGR